MRQKIVRGLIITSLLLTTLSLMFFIGLMIYNINRVILVQDASVFSIINSSILVLIGIVLVVSVSVSSFISFVSKKKIDHQQYLNMLYLLIIYRLIVYVFFSMIDYSLPNEVTGNLGGIHYMSYILVYRTDLLPVNVFPSPSVGFMHSLMSTDIISVGAVMLGFSLYKKDRYAPLIGALLAIAINLIFITYININVVNEFGVEFLYYKGDAILTTLMVEFALLGYTLQYVFLKKEEKNIF